MTDAQGKEKGICAGLGLSHGPRWDGGSRHVHTDDRHNRAKCTPHMLTTCKENWNRMCVDRADCRKLIPTIVLDGTTRTNKQNQI